MCHRSPRVAVECLALLCQLAFSAPWFGAESHSRILWVHGYVHWLHCKVNRVFFSLVSDVY